MPIFNSSCWAEVNNHGTCELLSNIFGDSAFTLSKIHGISCYILVFSYIGTQYIWNQTMLILCPENWFSEKLSPNFSIDQTAACVAVSIYDVISIHVLVHRFLEHSFHRSRFKITNNTVNSFNFDFVLWDKITSRRSVIFLGQFHRILR